MGNVRGRGKGGAGVLAIRRWGVSLIKDTSEGAAGFKTEGVISGGGGQSICPGVWC